MNYCYHKATKGPPFSEGRKEKTEQPIKLPIYLTPHIPAEVASLSPNCYNRVT